MKKGLFLTILFLFFTTNFNSAFALEKFVVELLEDIDLKNPRQECSVKALDDLYITYYDKIEKDSVITGKIVKLVPPRRLERDAYMVFKPTKYTIPSEDNKEVNILKNKKVKIRNKRVLDKKDVAANTFGTALSCFPPFTFIVPVAQFCMGIVKHEEGEHPFRGGFRYLVESWPFCYFLKGNDMTLTAGTRLELPLGEKMFNFDTENKSKKTDKSKKSELDEKSKIEADI